jgi:hypothetical protein
VRAEQYEPGDIAIVGLARDCRIKPDPIPIWRRPDERSLKLVWFGLHRCIPN